MFLAIIALAAEVAPISQTDVLSQIRDGKILCVNPDSATKTCSTIDRFSRTDSGVMVDTGELMLSGDKPVTLEVSSTTEINGGQICGTIELADLKRGIVRVNGELLPPDRNSLVLEKLLEGLKALAGRRVCEVLRIENGQLLKYGQVERVDIGLPPKPVIWVSSDAGYKVAPR